MADRIVDQRLEDQVGHECVERLGVEVRANAQAVFEADLYLLAVKVLPLWRAPIQLFDRAS